LGILVTGFYIPIHGFHQMRIGNHGQNPIVM